MAKPEPLDPRTVSIALIVALAQFMQMLDTAVISIALPQIGRQFQVSPVAVGMGITVYVLAASIVIPASAWLADRLGARKLFVASLAGFTLASLLCGLSGSLWQFIASRALQGIAGALMAPVGQLILLRSVERSQLLRIMTLTSAPMLVAPVIGPPLGGFLITWLGWPSIFYINIPAGLLAIGLALRWFPDLKGARRPFDRAGFLLNALALAPLLWGLGELGSPGRSLAAPIAAFGAGLVIGTLALRHARNAPHPLVSLQPMRHLSFRLTSGSGTILIYMPVMAIVFVLPILLQTGFGMTAFLSGLLFLGHSGGDLLMKLLTTRVFRRFGYRSVLIAGALAMSFAVAATALFTRSTPLFVIALVLFASGSFRSFVMGGLTTLSFADVSESEAPSASTFTQVIMQVATALGIGMSSVSLQISDRLLGAPTGAPSAEACRITLAVMAAVGLLATPVLLKLPHDAGAALSGHRASRRLQTSGGEPA